MRTKLVALAMIVVVLGVLVLQVSPVVNPPRWDEFIVVHDAHRVATGEVPYRDFFNFIPPGSFLVLAPVCALSKGLFLTGARYASSLAILVTVLLVALGLRRKGWPPGPSWLWAATLPVALYGFWAVPSHHWFAALCAAGVVALLAGRAESGIGPWFGAGLLAGLAATLVQTTGLSLAAFVLTLALLHRAARGRALAGVAAGVASVWGPLLLGLAFFGALGGFFRDVVVWPAQNYSRGGNENAGAALQDLPWRLGDLAAAYGADPSPSRALVAAAGFALYTAVGIAFLLLFAAALFFLLQVLRKRTVKDEWPLATSLAAVLALGLGARGNPNWLHLVYLLAWLGPLCLASVPPWPSWSPLGRRLATGLLGTLLVTGVVYHTRSLWFHAPSAWEFTDADRIIREQPINAWLRSPGVLAAGDTLAAFPEGGEVYLYAAPAAVGYTYFRPLGDRYNSAEDHAEVARQIDQRKPRFILVPPDLERDYLDPASPVGKSMALHYARDRVIGNAVVYRWHDAPSGTGEGAGASP